MGKVKEFFHDLLEQGLDPDSPQFYDALYGPPTPEDGINEDLLDHLSKPPDFEYTIDDLHLIPPTHENHL